MFQKDHFRLLFRIDSSQNLSKNFIDRSLCFDYRIRFGFREAFVPEIDEAQIAIPFDFWILVANVNFFYQSSVCLLASNNCVISALRGAGGAGQNVISRKWSNGKPEEEFNWGAKPQE